MTRDTKLCAGGCGHPHDGLAPTWNLLGGPVNPPSTVRFCGNCYDAYVRMT